MSRALIASFPELNYIIIHYSTGTLTVSLSEFARTKCYLDTGTLSLHRGIRNGGWSREAQSESPDPGPGAWSLRDAIDAGWAGTLAAFGFEARSETGDFEAVHAQVV